MLDEPAAERLVVARDGVEDLAQGEPVAIEPVGIDDHLVLPRQPAPRVDLADASHGPEARANLPIMKRLALHRVGGSSLDEVLVNLAERSGDGAQDRLDASRQPAARLADPLAH